MHSVEVMFHCHLTGSVNYRFTWGLVALSEEFWFSFKINLKNKHAYKCNTL